MPPPTQNQWRPDCPEKYRRLWRQMPLFQAEDGAPLRFYIRPGPTKVEVAPLILRHGGRVCAVQEPGVILLAGPSEVPAGSPGVYTSTAYVSNCLMCNRLLPLEDYRLNPQPSPQVAAANGSTCAGRVPFTVADDRAIVRHVRSRGQDDHLAGIAFWKDMARARVTAHPWQAMRDRYLRHLRGKEELYQTGRNSQRQDEPRINNAERMLAVLLSSLAQGTKEKAATASRAQDPPRTADASEIPRIFKMANEEFEDGEIQTEGGESLSSEEERLPKDAAPKASEDPPPGGPEDPPPGGPEPAGEAELASSESLLPAQERPPGAPAEEVVRAVEDMRRLMAEFGVDLATATQALLKNSGEVAAAAACLGTGQRPDRGPLWTRQDDLDLSAGSDALRSKLSAKYGAEKVAARVAFRNS